MLDHPTSPPQPHCCCRDVRLLWRAPGWGLSRSRCSAQGLFDEPTDHCLVKPPCLHAERCAPRPTRHAHLARHPDSQTEILRPPAPQAHDQWPCAFCQRPCCGHTSAMVATASLRLQDESATVGEHTLPVCAHASVPCVSNPSQAAAKEASVDDCWAGDSDADVVSGPHFHPRALGCTGTLLHAVRSCRCSYTKTAAALALDDFEWKCRCPC